jgi:glycosyltransferase involved in cell wall biosynthesis
VRNQLAFFGFVRPYKGLGDLLTALALASSRPALAVLGEFWEPVERYRQRIEQLGLVDRVTLDVGYASEAAVTELLNSSDALVLPYRTATGSQMPRLAFTHHTPVIATDAGDLAQQVRHGIDGLVCPANDPSSLAGAIDQLYEGTTLTRLRSGVRTPSATDEWAAYLDAVLAAVEPRP